jgi:hypothetical protein
MSEDVMQLVMEQKVAELRRLIEDVGVVTRPQLAARWGITQQRVSQMLSQPGAPAPLFPTARTHFYALPEAEAYRASR